MHDEARRFYDMGGGSSSDKMLGNVTEESGQELCETGD